MQGQVLRRRTRALLTGMTAVAIGVAGSVAATVGTSAPARADDGDTVLSSDFEGTDTAPWQGRGATVGLSADARTGAQALIVTERTSSWNGAQVDVSDLFVEGEYHVTGWVKLVEGEAATQVNFGVNQPGAENEYPWVGSRVAVTDSTWVQLDGYYTVDPATPPAALYLESASATAQLLLDDVVITQQGGASNGPEPGTVLIDTDFEDDSLQGWAPRQPDSTTPTLSIVADGADGTGLAAQVSDRDSDGDGLQYDVAGAGASGITLEFEAWVRFADGEEPGELTLSAHTVRDGTDSYSNLAAITGATSDGWTQVGGRFVVPAYDGAAELYWETKYNSGNTSTFLVDQIRLWVPEPAQWDSSLTRLQDTIDVPGVGVAIDARETTDPASELLLHHFNQITAENHMKVESWYEGTTFRRHPEATALLDFAATNDLRLYGHVLLWHSQTPAWFFEREDGTALTSSEADKQFLRERLRTHVFDVAASIATDYGPYGSAGNPLVGIDVVNEVVSDANEPSDGLRRSAWYSILGEEYISLAFEYADEAFNSVYADEGSERPVALFINDYNTEQSAKQDRYVALVERLLDAGVPVDGVGHQFHASLTTTAASLDAALTRFADLPVVQAVTELDATVGTPVTEANLIAQGHWYNDAFEVFRAHAEDLFGVTLWGLTDTRSWRSAQAPLLFDGDLTAKYAYYGAVGDEDNVPALLTAANVFGGDVALTPAAADAVEWRNLPAQQLTGGAGSFIPRWNDDHLTLLVTVAAQDSEEIQIAYAGVEYGLTRDADATGGASGTVIDDGGDGWRAVLQLPHTDITVGEQAQLDVRVLRGGAAVGAWNTPGETGTLTFLEDLSTVEVVHATDAAPAVDGAIDEVWDTANAVQTDTTVEGDADGARAQVRTLWSGEDTLYVLFEVTDPIIDVSSGDPWVQDSVELFLDLGNAKSGGYGPNDSQMRISVDNTVSFGTGDPAAQAARLTSATARTDTGYVVELAVDLRGQSGGQSDVPFGGPDTFHGLDFQVNDGRDGFRYSVHTWAEPSGTGYQTTARWGVGHLVAAPAPAYPEFDAVTIYDDGDRVSFEGAVYEAQWWTRGTAPDAGPWGSWMRVGEQVQTPQGTVPMWTSSWVYTGGETVVHDGHLWQAAWWTRNQEPGDPYGPWQDLGAL